MATQPPLMFVPIGTNSAHLFGMDARTRACRLATNMGMECADEAAGRDAVLANMAFAWNGTVGSLAGLEQIDGETAELSYSELRKRERPFIMPLDPANPVAVERAAYDAAYKGVTDILTLYLWRKPAFHLTRWAAQAGMTPNMVTAIGAVFCVLAFYLFWIGSYWPGVAAGFVFMVLDTVDG